MMAFRELAIKAIASVRPSLFYYKANALARAGIKVVQSDHAIDIIRVADRKIIRISRINYIYLLEMIESFDYFFDSALPVTVQVGHEHYALVDFSTPRLHVVAGFDDFAVMCPSLTEPFSSIQQYLDFASLSPGDVVLDLGAYSALTSVAFSKAVGPTGKVVALEPDPMNFRAATYNIARNLQHNGLQNIELLPAAVADRPGVLQLSSEGAMGSSLTSIVGRHRGTVIDVDCVTLQSLVDTQGLDKVDFIKIDIEGSELPVILGSGEFLRRYMPRLIIEPHPIGGISTGGPIREFLESLGYDCEIIDQPGLSLPLLTARPPN